MLLGLNTLAGALFVATHHFVRFWTIADKVGFWPETACPLMAQSGHDVLHCECPLSGVKRTSLLHRKMSANDPKRTLRP